MEHAVERTRHTCMAPGCERTDIMHIYPVMLSDEEMLTFGYCPEHYSRPYSYEIRGEEAPEIAAAYKQIMEKRG